ncbi:MAG TPA: serine/threonine-protein kinase [Kofleriaceae bacterium]|nr:serine/threonine-protein kinase [Kofleriaceae bacterium]
MIGAATIARLAYVAGLDLAAAHATSAIVPVRSGDRDADVVITVRPGDGLRADLVVMTKGRAGQRPTPAASGSVGLVGDLIGNYRIIEPLGEGGMGTVFRVEHVVLGRTYALKVLRSKVFEKDSSASQRFVREARAAARVRHANICDVFDFGHLADGRPYFVMELLEGESLTERVARGALDPAEVVSIGRQIATALAAVHDHGVIHGDVTPSNALVVTGEPPVVKLVDFGLAAIAGEGFTEEESDFVLGTPAYISPEQLRGLPATDRSDQYGLGAVLFELLAGRPPYVHENLRELCLMHVQAPIPQVTSPHGPLPPKLADVITTCLQKSPQARFPGMRAMIAALDEVERVTDRRGWRKWLSS